MSWRDLRPSLRRRRRPRSEDWGLDMTLCIAAISQTDNRVVTVSDFMLSTRSMSAETAVLKVEPISPSGRWLGAFAGSPSVLAEVYSDVIQKLADGRPETLETMVSVFEEAYRAALKRKIERTVLTPFGLDRDAFIRDGLRQFGKAEFARLLYTAEAVALKTDFMLAGINPQGWPRIFSVEEDGVHHHDRLGFYAIGSGADLANASLYATYDAALPTNDLIYRLCEAKFRGESALGVGKQTVVLTVDKDGKHERLLPEHVAPIRAAWERDGRPPVPPDALAAIAANLAPLKGWRKDRT
jgi:ATP-dependent protease HslVU (ClpYQ) peptidase subunit